MDDKGRPMMYWEEVQGVVCVDCADVLKQNPTATIRPIQDDDVYSSCCGLCSVDLGPRLIRRIR